MSASKQNTHRVMFQSKHRRSLKNLYESNAFYITTQGLFENKECDAKGKEKEWRKMGRVDFHKTVANTQVTTGWPRPESKHANRNVLTRPQTSKGSRKQPNSNPLFIPSNHHESALTKSTTSKRLLTRKVVTKQPCHNEDNVLINNWQRYNPRKDEPSHNDEVYPIQEEVDIIVNRRPPSQYGRKGPSVHKNKFETDLDDEFLELFAD